MTAPGSSSSRAAPGAARRRAGSRSATGAPLPRRRLVALLAVMAVLAAMVVGRLVVVQAVSAERFAAVGESQRTREVRLSGERGAVFDRRGAELALSVRRPTVWANPQLVADPDGQAEALAPLLGQPAGELAAKLRRRGAFVYLERTVDEETAAKVEALDLAGVFTLTEPERVLPAGELAAPLLGRVDVDGKGISGLELQHEPSLAGSPGRLVVERSRDGHDITGGLRLHEPSTRGDDLVLTIDRSLQYETERALAEGITAAEAQGGMVVVMDTRSGEVLAMASMVAGAEEGSPPRPTKGAAALTRVYEPGSVEKLVTVAAALEEGEVRPDEVLTVDDAITVEGSTFEDHDPHPVEPWSITDIVANSSNVGSIMIGQRLGKERLHRYLQDFGFGKRTGLGYPDESGGLLDPPERWSGTSLPTLSIGYGLAVTATQMLAAYNTVANAGVYVTPKLVRATIDGDGRERPAPASPERRVISSETAAQMTAMLAEVVRAGTGKKAAIDGYTVAGKTGTARMVGASGGYEPGAYTASFAGFVPAERPTLSAIVVLDRPSAVYFGGQVAAPVFARIGRYALREFKIPPAPAVETIAAVPPVSPEAACAAGDAGAARGGVCAELPAAPATTAAGDDAPDDDGATGAATATTARPAPATTAAPKARATTTTARSAAGAPKAKSAPGAPEATRAAGAPKAGATTATAGAGRTSTTGTPRRASTTTSARRATVTGASRAPTTERPTAAASPDP